MFDEKIDEKGIDAVMGMWPTVSQTASGGFRQQISDQDLRAALTEAKARADAAEIPAEPEAVDPSDELKRIIDESLPGASVVTTECGRQVHGLQHDRASRIFVRAEFGPDR